MVERELLGLGRDMCSTESHSSLEIFVFKH